MRLRILSDLHLEFHRDGGRTFIAGQRDAGYDVLVLAGDIATLNGLPPVIEWFREAAGSRPIVWVPGNHEYYGTSVVSMGDFLAHLADPSLYGLDNRVVVLDGQRFVGSTLWFSHSGGWDPMDDRLNDFQLIEGFRQWVGDHARCSAAFLRENVRERDIVVTHHLPHPRSIHPRYEGDPLNRYFLHDVSKTVEQRGASLWIHGHTHVSLDYQVGLTRVLCNPFGYLRYEENSDFVEHLTYRINEGER